MSVSPPGPEVHVYQPGELNREVRLHLEAGFPRLWISGEISNFARPSSGHWYFTLKDSRAQLRCALFRGNRANAGVEPANGDQVLVRGRLSLFEPRGEYQLIADALLPAGSGALQQAFEALKKKLEAEGLFDARSKKTLPRYPARIAVITSPTGAAIRDILTTLERRWPAAVIDLYATPVQGEQAVPGLLRAFRQVAGDARAEVILLARGGGSLEDLWAFNDERLARAIHASTIPVVCGVGHETDFTIADFAADLRAATPTSAAEAATPDGPALRRQLTTLQNRALAAHGRQLQQSWQRLDSLDRRLRGQHPARRLAETGTRLAALRQRLRRIMQARITEAQSEQLRLSRRLLARHPAGLITRLNPQQAALLKRLLQAVRSELTRHAARLGETARALHAVSPLAVLARGYALIEDENGRLLSRKEDFSPGRNIISRVRDLRVRSCVTDVEQVADADMVDPLARSLVEPDE